MTPPIFSILMPAYNTSRTIASAIRSLLAQTRQDFELIVVDDGSTDDTARHVDPFLDDRRVRLIRQENHGLAAARNAAIGVAGGEYLCLLDSDDLWMPDYLAVLGEAMDGRPGVALAYSDAWVLDDLTRRIRRRTYMVDQGAVVSPPADPREWLTLLLRKGNVVFGSAMLRRSAIDEVGLFDTRLPASEDYEMWMRLAAHGYAVVRRPDRLVIYRRRTESLTGDELRMLLTRREALRIVAEEYDVSDEAREQASVGMSALDAQIATLRGHRRTRAMLLRSRRYLGRGKRAMMASRLWHERPPPEITDAFPDLQAV